MSFQKLADNTVLSIIAPTASGKTALAYELYETGKFELISVDSALIYKDMNIGTAKPTRDELNKYPHHLVDILTPESQYNVSEFCDDVNKLIKKIHNNNKIPILVGGTMMYYKSMFTGISAIPSTLDSTRMTVMNWMAESGLEDLYRYLQIHDSVSASRLNMADTQRITRAVEVHIQTGQPLSEWQKEPQNAIANNAEQNWLAYTVTPDRSWLHGRIELRLDQMWKQGFIEEVIHLVDSYKLNPNSPAMRCIGYRQIIDVLLAEKLLILDNDVLICSDLLNNDTQKKALYSGSLIEKNACQDMRNKALYATRQLAKRQCTWLKKLNKMSDCSKVDIHDFDSIQEVKKQLIY